MSGAENKPDSPLGTGPTTHYEGFVEKKGPKDKDYVKQWMMLIGNSMMLYNQRLALRDLNTAQPGDAVVVDKYWDIKPDNKEKTKLTIKCKAGQYKFKMSTMDDRDNWWIRFYALAKMEHPKVNLLPGQTIALQEIIDSTKSTTSLRKTKTFIKQKSAEKPGEQEMDMNKKCRFYPEELCQGFREAFPIPPTWYFQVNRAQAEELLMNNPEQGAIIIRKSESGGENTYSLSMRQDPPLSNCHAQPIIKHFRFSWEIKPGTFRLAIEEEQPVMKTMYDLLAFFIDKHGGNIKPMQSKNLKILQHPYELELRVSSKDPENGEARPAQQDTYLQPHRAAPVLPPGPRPDRQSLPATFNMSFANAHGAEAATPQKRLSAVCVPRPSIPSQYVVPNHERSLYINVDKDKLPTVNEDGDQNMQRRQKRFSTSAVPSYIPDEPRAPQLPPPRQRCISSSDASSSGSTQPYSSSITGIYNTPSGQTFALQHPKPSPMLPLATADTSSTKAGTRPRSKTVPATSVESGCYLTPINTKILLSQEPGNEPLPRATKPSSHTALSNQHLVPKQPIINHRGSHPAPPTSYIHPEGKPRRTSLPLALEGNSTPPAQAELDKIFKKFGIKEEN